MKAEILWTRVCPLRCHYCGMVDGRTNSYNLELWKKGIEELKKRGCKFIAFYGAEPLYDVPKKLAEVVGYAEHLGIHTTVISSGQVEGFKEIVKNLYERGLRSLSVSYDMIPLDKYSEQKSKEAIESLIWFRSLGDIRDIAAIATLTRTNYHLLSKTIHDLTSKGIWFFFDFIHPDRGQIGSKCRGNNEHLLFKEDDFSALRIALEEVLYLKERGFLCHSSKPFLESIMKDNFSKLRHYDWNCAQEENFPAWLSVDCDGEVGICDDFRPQMPFSFLLHELGDEEKWQGYMNEFKRKTKEQCPGCCWNTHIDAHLVKRGVLSIKDYVHGEGVEE